MRDAGEKQYSPDENPVEWLETDGLGGFAMGTIDGVRTRRYHGLLIAARHDGDPANRVMLFNGFDAWLETPGGRVNLTSQRYAPDADHPRFDRTIESFSNDPWPKWIYSLADGTRVEHEIFMRHGSPLIALAWRLLSPSASVRLHVRPFLSGRDYHSLHRENNECRFVSESERDHVTLRTYSGVPSLVITSNGSYRHEPHWYRNFLYIEERERGFECTEDLAAPGVFAFDLSNNEAILIAASGDAGDSMGQNNQSANDTLSDLRKLELTRRQRFHSSLHRAADQYLVKRGEGKTIIAGYPWFADWGRDTFIAMRGLCLAANRLHEALQILLAWSTTISQGMLPNRFPDSSSGESASEPEYNSVDASLWFVIATHEWLQRADEQKFPFVPADRRRLQNAILEVVSGYASGTRFGIRMDERDCLLAAGEAGQQLTWMDARVDGREVTPRIGKPVEIQALWLNALWIASQFADRWRTPYLKGLAKFEERFWNQQAQCLFDVIDEDHVEDRIDPTLRPNQIFAIGGLPMPLIKGDHARKIVDAVEKRLLTPLGLRTLPRDDSRYTLRYAGGPAPRDAAYHQGTVWPWLMGAFVEAWVRVRGETRDAVCEARARFVDPLKQHLVVSGFGHVSEIADAEPPHTPRGCPFQAWSIGELIRIQEWLSNLGSEAGTEALSAQSTCTSSNVAQSFAVTGCESL